MTAEQIAQKSMKIAAKMCIYTNDSFTTLKLEN
jgi:ATP-dependent protease HslVU (ClpYQ) peptidase subunit